MPVLPLAAATLVGDQENPKDLIAAQVREQGHTCEAPKSAERDESQSGPDSEVWTLECENASYRVRLVPDMAADIEQIN
ncbi:hypothetical protein H2509_03380 [Stappia sp. F7233]|uniref:Uncharacterized protein n=2 Tax=Stappia albiluteola TaxID=2758565 RepID=A0A839A9U0_9HYPH|nr:hypothetical protein [Stappia albiluteola]